jgi:hypothetical protein
MNVIMRETYNRQLLQIIHFLSYDMENISE